MNLVVCNDPIELASQAAAEFARIAKEAIRDRGAFTVSLSGGSTPLLLYRNLVDSSLDWGKVFFFFGDERNVSPDEDASNFRNANKELFRPLRIREDRIFRWRTELEDPETVTDDYRRRLTMALGDVHSKSSDDARDAITSGFLDLRLDLIILGMGSDGHTASLFPGTEALSETEQPAVSNLVPQLGAWRYTFSFPMINAARNVIFLVAGADKAATLRMVLEGGDDVDLPAKRVKAVDGSVTWFVDRAAASKLSDTAG